MRLVSLVTAVAVGVVSTMRASADPFFFSTGEPDGRIAIAARPTSPGESEITSADDFVLSAHILINQATFTGLLSAGATIADIGEIRVEIYQVFPLDSNTGRTSGPPVFSTSQIPTRVNSPSDDALAGRSISDGSLSFAAALINPSFTAANSIVSGGINPAPNQTTGGNGPATGQEVLLSVSFSSPFDLPAGHYFVAPQVAVAGTNEFQWLSSPRPIVAPGTPFLPDLQTWIRDENLAPDWLRVGTDIIGGAPAPLFNAAFTLMGETVPEPATPTLVGLGILAALGMLDSVWRQPIERPVRLQVNGPPTRRCCCCWRGACRFPRL